MSKIDFRSDTITRPCKKMLEKMFAAEVGDDVYGDDPTVNAFEEKLADLVGKEAAVFVPTGTMANQIAIKIHTRPGDSIICEEDVHCYLYEGGASSALAGVQFDFVPFEERLSDAWIKKLYRTNENIHTSPTTLLVVENTHNRGAGRVLDSKELRRITTTAKSTGLKTHCDGARIWNAAVALGETEKSLLEGFDSASVCFSKGLGAPIGSALVGSKSMILAARRERKRYGAAMRQVGYLAAAADYAIDNNRARLAEDHTHAETLLHALDELPGSEVLIQKPVTNMVYVRFEGRDAEEIISELAKRDIVTNPLGDGWIRMVTHLHISSDDIQKTANAFAEIVSL